MSKKKYKNEHKIKFVGELTYESDVEIIEEFKTIAYKDYGNITINNLGTKIYTKTNKEPSIFIDESGYLAFNAGTSIKGGRSNHTPMIHRVVAEAFIPNPNNLPEVNHKDLNKFNNCVSNLEWVSTLENNKHARANGLMRGQKGEDNGRAKLTNEQIKEIRKNFTGKRGEKTKLAKEYNVSWTLIDLIVNNKIWTHI